MDQSTRHDSTEGAFARERDGGSFRLALQGEVVTPLLFKADTMWTRMRGLLGRGGLAPSEGLWISPCNSIHMFFMRFAIDVVFVDREMAVRKVVERLRPWRMAGCRGARAAIELPAGAASRSGITVGERLVLEAVGG
jgi:uncharacterized membrane protein (UPF0127 family)